eukprot:525887-Prorocentrum_minimum.AAC.1
MSTVELSPSRSHAEGAFLAVDSGCPGLGTRAARSSPTFRNCLPLYFFLRLVIYYLLFKRTPPCAATLYSMYLYLGSGTLDFGA